MMNIGPELLFQESAEPVIQCKVGHLVEGYSLCGLIRYSGALSIRAYIISKRKEYND